MANGQPNPDADRLERWSHLVDGVLHELLPAGTRVALVNFPNHANAGDSAIWLGALASLRRMQVHVAYRASWATYEPTALRRALGEGVVLLQGGGNFGDLYPANQQATRERVLADLADVRAIQLPQSIHFDDPENLERMRRLCESHSDFTLLVREEQSQAYAREHFAVPVELCPDLALALDPHDRVREPRVDLLHLARVDKEAVPADPVDPPGVSVERVDWLAELDDEPPWPIADRARLRLNRLLLERSAKSPGFARRTWKDSAMTFEALGQRWVHRADAVLARGRVVRTDRLHAHLLSLLQGIPHVIEDNATGKVRAFHDTWTNTCSLTHWADGPAEAAEIAGRLVEDARQARR
jgi:exopolysaccharide biosynthesis predicted pyruvyltransferase EpsI